MLRQRHTAGQAASAVAPDRPTQAILEAETEVVPKVSPQSVIQAKAQQLAAAGPSGWPKALVYAAVCVPLWLTSLVQLAIAAITRPSDVFNPPDPKAFKLQPPFPLHEEYLEVNGIKLHTVSPGRQPGKALMLMLHGFPECWYSWRHQMVAFAQDYDVVALDMRGYNLSDKPKGVHNYMLDVLASDVRGAVAALGHSSCTLVAHDWGGGVAWVTAGMYGQDLVKQLIVMGLPHLGISSTNMSPSQNIKSSYIMTFQAPYLPEKVFTLGNASVMYKAFVTPPMGVRNVGAITDQDIDWYRASFCQPGAANAMFNYYRGLVRWQLWGDREGPIWRAVRRQLEMPVLVLHGDSDVALGVELLDGIEAVAPKVTVKVLKNCSHWVQQDYPMLTNKLMKGWLAQQVQQ